ncbi:MAG: bifunctional nuclease family protein [Acidimicrobiales bacterium]
MPLPDPYPVVTLEDTEGSSEQIAFRIGTSEGVALAGALAGTSSARPLTHELFATALERMSIDVVAFRLTGRVGVTYLGEIDLVGSVGRQVLSCRPSDGICLALRRRGLPAPLLADERLFSTDGDVERDGS